MWVSPPNPVEEWIQAEPWRRSARKERSGWRSSTGCDVCNEIVSAWNITTSGKCVVTKSTQQCHTSWAPLNINRGCLVEQLTDQSLVIVRMEAQKQDERSAKSLTSVEQLITCDTKSFSDFYWKLRKLVAMPLLKLTRHLWPKIIIEKI